MLSRLLSWPLLGCSSNFRSFSNKISRFLICERLLPLLVEGCSISVLLIQSDMISYKEQSIWRNILPCITSFKMPKWTEKNGTQIKHHFPAQFSIPFHMVSSVLLQVLAQKNISWLVGILWQASIHYLATRLLKLTLATKRSTQCEREWKTVPENGVFSCVPFCLRSLRRFARCVLFCNVL